MTDVIRHSVNTVLGCTYQNDSFNQDIAEVALMVQHREGRGRQYSADPRPTGHAVAPPYMWASIPQSLALCPCWVFLIGHLATGQSILWHLPEG